MTRRFTSIDDENNVYSPCNAGDNLTFYPALLVSAEREIFFDTATAPGHIVKRRIDATNSMTTTVNIRAATNGNAQLTSGQLNGP